MKKNIFILLVTATILLFGCITPKIPNPQVKIAISKASGGENYEKYEKWLEYNSPYVNIIDLNNLDYQSAINVISGVDGLLLSGGLDVHPKYYNQAEDSSRCSIDLQRDSLEFELIKIALKLEMPILGICRGEQILNIAFGGSSVVDILQDIPQSKVVHQKPNGDAMHKILVKRGTLLHKITSLDEGLVNSNHHQSVNILAHNLEASAITEDLLIEAFSYKNFENMPFLLGVQWHPERLEYDNPFSYEIAKAFIENAQGYYRLKNQKFYASQPQNILSNIIFWIALPLLIVGFYILWKLMSIILGLGTD